MIKLLIDYYKIMQKAVDENIPLQRILELPVKTEIDRMRLIAADNFPSFAEHIEEERNKEFKSTGGKQSMALAGLEYTTIKDISGPLIFVESGRRVGYWELPRIKTPSGARRSGKLPG